MTAREAILQKIRTVSTKANSINCYFVVTFWNAPITLGNTLECEVAYFEEYLSMEDYYDSQMKKRERVALPYQVFSSDNSFYTSEFYNDVDRQLQNFNIHCLFD